MRLFTVLAIVLVGCQSGMVEGQSSVPHTSPSGPAVCGDAEPIHGDGVELVLAGIARAQTNDLQCGPPGPQARMCRALFAIATLDPAHHLGDQPQFQRVSEALQWALSDATPSAPPDLRSALEDLAAATRQLRSARTEHDQRRAIDRRSDPVVIATLDHYWVEGCAPKG